MSTELKQVSKRWADQYASLLEAYVQQPSEDALRQAAALGRSLFHSGVAPHDVARTHMACSERVCAQRAAGGSIALSAGEALFEELMKVYNNACKRQRTLASRRVQWAQRLKRTIAQLNASQQALQSSEARLRLLLDQTPAIIWTTDTDLHSTSTAGAGLKRLKAKPSDIVGASLFELLRTDDPECLPIAMHRRALQGESVNYEDRLGGNVYEVHVEPLRDPNGRIVGCIGIALDITERKQAEEKLLETERQAQRLLSVSPAVVYRCGPAPDYPTTFISDNIVTHLGYRPDQFYQDSSFWVKRIHPEDAERVQRELARTERGELVSYEYRFLHRDGRYLWLHDEVLPLRDADGHVVGLVGSWFDVTARREAEETARREQQLLQLLMDNIPDNVYFKDRESRFTRVNHALAHFAGVDHPDELVGTSDADMYSPDMAAGFRADERRILTSGQPIIGKVEQAHPEASEPRWFSTTKVPIRSPAGEIVGIVGVSRDITERKRAEEALRTAHDELEQRVQQRTAELAAANTRLRREIAERKQMEEALRSERDHSARIINGTPAIVCGVTPDGATTFVNPAGERITGYTAEELIGRNWWRVFYPGQEHRQVEQLFRDFAQGDVRDYEMVLTTRAGEKRTISWNSINRFDDSGKLVEIIGFGNDVTERKWAEEALRESEMRYRAVFEQAADSIMLVDPEAEELVEFNDRAHENLGYTREEFQSLKPSDFEAIESAEEITRHLAQIVKEGTDAFETTHRTKDGAIRHVLVSATTIRIRQKDIILSVGRDITERKRAEEALRRSDETTRVLLNASPDAGILIDTQGHILALNDTCAGGLGGSPEELVGQYVFERFPPDVAQLRKARTQDVIRSGQPLRFEDEHAGRVFDNGVYPIFDAHGRVERVAVFARNVTDQRRAQQALRESEELFRTIVSASKDAMVAVGRRGSITLFNPAAEEMFGRKSSEMIGQPLDCLMPEEYRTLHRRYLEDYFRKPASRDVTGRTLELSALRADGAVVPIELSLSPGQRGEEQFVLAVIRDIAERKRVAAVLQEQTEVLENILTHIPYSVFWKDRNSVYLGCNQHFAEEAGVETPEQVVGRTDYDLPWSKKQADFFTQCDRQVISTGQALPDIEESLRRVDGSDATVLTSKTPFRDLDGKIVGVLGIYADITKRKRMEETLRRQALVFENMYDAVIVADPEERVVDWNPGAERTFGYTRDEVLGKIPAIWPQPADLPNLAAEINETVRRADQWSGEIGFVHKDGGERLCEAVIVAARDEKNRFVGTIGVARDITARRRAEEEARRRQEELAHVSRFATMGEMATGLAHDLNQPLSAILYYARGCGRRLRAGTWDLDEVLDVTEKVAVQAERAAALISGLRKMVRKTAPRLSPVDMNGLIREAVSFIGYEAKKSNVTIDFQLGERLRPVQADMIEIEQVILNLLRNGIEAMQETQPGERRLTLRTSNAGSDAVMCAVSDTGQGVSEEAVDRLFDTFFTTKPEGMGMGLSISRSIIEAHGGRLWATPNAGGGTTFQFTLPVVREGRRHGA